MACTIGTGHRVTHLLDSQGTEQSTVSLQAGFILECEVYLSQATQASIHSRGGRPNAPLNWETGSAWCFLLFHKDKKSTFVRNRSPRCVSFSLVVPFDPVFRWWTLTRVTVLLCSYEQSSQGQSSAWLLDQGHGPCDSRGLHKLFLCSPRVWPEAAPWWGVLPFA